MCTAKQAAGTARSYTAFFFAPVLAFCLFRKLST
jgi:hypothetical protein